MSIAEYKPRAEYIGAGNLHEYSFDFKITSLDQIITRVTDPSFVLVWEVRGVDLINIAGITYDPVLGKGLVTLAADLPTNYNLTILLAPDSPIQTTEFRNKADFTLRRLEQALDVQLSAIQRLSYSVQRAIKLSDNFKMSDSFDTKLPINSTDELIQDNRGRVLQMNATNDGLEFGLTQAQQVESLADLIEDIVVELLSEAGGLPPGGDQYANIEKLSSTTGDAAWTDPIVYDGISARFGNTLFQKSGLKPVLDEIIKITYTPPVVSLSGSSNILREKGAPVTATTLTASVTKKSNLIAEARFYKGATLLDTQTSGGAIPNGGNSTYDWTGSFSDNTTFSVQVDDASGGGGPTTVTASTTFSFVYPYYVGAGSSGISAASVASLTKRVIASTASRVETITATGGQVFYFAYPASYGALTSILDVNNFETLPDWTLRTENITGLDGNAVSYRIYEFNNPVAAGSYQYTFKR